MTLYNSVQTILIGGALLLSTACIARKLFPKTVLQLVRWLNKRFKCRLLWSILATEGSASSCGDGCSACQGCRQRTSSPPVHEMGIQPLHFQSNQKNT
jgi:hypothetical protein